MFKGCVIFNQPLKDWDISNVENMNSMFEGCKKFNQSLNKWKINLWKSKQIFKNTNIKLKLKNILFIIKLFIFKIIYIKIILKNINEEEERRVLENS